MGRSGIAIGALFSLVLAMACGSTNDAGGKSTAPEDAGASLPTSTSTSSGRDAATPSVGTSLAPVIAPTVSWNIDLENPVDENVDAAWFDVDLWDNIDSGLVGRLHTKGRRVACYFSAGSGEDWRPDYATIPAAALGKGLDGWPGEKWLDTRSAVLRDVMRARLDRAKSAGCDGVDPDNVDGFANASGFPLTAETQLDYNRFLATEAHARGLAIGLKNDVDQISDLVSSFDFAVNESCFQFDECDAVAAFVKAGKSVLNIEYGDVVAHQASVCPPANTLQFFSILSAVDHLDGTYTKCR